MYSYPTGKHNLWYSAIIRFVNYQGIILIKDVHDLYGELLSIIK